MATRNPNADIFEKDPKNKWEGGNSLNTDTGTSSSQFKRQIYQEQRVLNLKVQKLSKMLLDKNLSTAERYALKKALADSTKSMKTVAENSAKELEFLKSNQRYNQEAIRKLGSLREFMRQEANKKTGPMSAKQQKEREEQEATLKRVDKILQDLTGKDVGTSAGRLGTLKALSRLDRDMAKLPPTLQKLFEQHEQYTEEMVEMQRGIWEEQQAANKKAAEEAKARAEKEKKERESFVDDQKKRDAKLKAEQEKRDREERAAQLEDRLQRGYQAHRELQDAAKRRTDAWKQRGLSTLDRLGIGALSVGTLVRGGLAANKLRKDYKGGRTSFQKYMQNRALASGRDPSKLKYGLGRIEQDEDKEGKYRARMTAKWGGAAPAEASAVQVPDTASKWGSRAKDGDFEAEDQLEVQQEISDTLKSYASEEARANARLLEAVKRHKVGGNGEAANSNSYAGSAAAGAAGGAMGSALKGLLGMLPGLIPTVLPGLMAVLTPALLLKLGVDQKARIDANPNAPEFKDNAYAMLKRGEADSVTQATKMNQQKALKLLQPGVAKQYLDAGMQSDGKYLDGYSKSQLEDMAAGRKPSEALDGFVKIQTGAQKAASAAQAASDDNGDTQRMAARAPVQIAPVASTDAMGNAQGGSTMGSDMGATAGGGTVSGGSSISKSKAFTKSSGVDTDGINGNMQGKLTAMGEEYYQKTGKKVNINSGYRSMEKQAQLYKTMKPGMAAKPGSSLHNYGLAVDIPSSTTNELDKLGLLSKYGFERPIPNEPWHVQPKGMSVAAAKSGIYSADAPQDQSKGGAGTAKATPSSPSVASASVESPATSGSPTTGENASKSASNGSTGGSSGSVSSIPTFDSSDGMFLALNMGVV